MCDGTGADEKLALQNKLEETFQEIKRLEEASKALEDFTLALAGCPEVAANAMISASELASKVARPSSQYFDNELMSLWSSRAVEERAVADADVLAHGNEFEDEKLPARHLVKHAFFIEKEVKDGCEQAKKKHQALKEKYNAATEGLDKNAKRRRKTAEKMRSQMLEGTVDPMAKAVKLARRNQINRVRKSIRKPKRVREEENQLPEAGPSANPVSCVLN